MPSGYMTHVTRGGSTVANPKICAIELGSQEAWAAWSDVGLLLEKFSVWLACGWVHSTHELQGAGSRSRAHNLVAWATHPSIHPGSFFLLDVG